jgi:AraC family transcriptional regulator
MLLTDQPGVLEHPGIPKIVVAIHVGRSVEIACRRDGQSHRGTAVHGDIDIIPAGIPSLWEIKNESDTAFILSLAPRLVNAVTEELGFDPGRVAIRNRFQVRDPQIENIAWALKTEMGAGYPCGQLYVDSLAVSVATRLVSFHSSVGREPTPQRGGLPRRVLKQVLSYIEDNLTSEMSLSDIALVSGLSVSHLKVLFREAMGFACPSICNPSAVGTSKAFAF